MRVSDICILRRVHNITLYARYLFSYLIYYLIRLQLKKKRKRMIKEYIYNNHA